MTEGGKRIGHIKGILADMVKAGVTPLEIDAQATRLIKAGGDKCSFMTVDDYKYATCINVNSGMVHGIPTSKPFQEGDVVKVDMGLMHDGYHLDTCVTVQIPPHKTEVTKFLETTKKSLEAAIFAAIPGNTVYDIGLAMQTVVEGDGYNVVRDLTGHGISRKLHENPFIPCYGDKKDKNKFLSVDQTIAIEAMTTMGDYHLVEDSDGWTLSTQDGSITAMFEETVYLTPSGPLILTKIN
jgi:methionyl aminopeptidase